MNEKIFPRTYPKCSQNTRYTYDMPQLCTKCGHPPPHPHPTLLIPILPSSSYPLIPILPSSSPSYPPHPHPTLLIPILPSSSPSYPPHPIPSSPSYPPHPHPTLLIPILPSSSYPLIPSPSPVRSRLHPPFHQAAISSRGHGCPAQVKHTPYDSLQ